jgi:hypothetical protein
VFTGRLFGDFHTNFLHSGIAHWHWIKAVNFSTTVLLLRLAVHPTQMRFDLLKMMNIK